MAFTMKFFSTCYFSSTVIDKKLVLLRDGKYEFFTVRHVLFPADIIVNSAGNPVVVVVWRVGVGQLEVALLRGGVGPRQVVLGSLQFITGPRVAENNSDV